jgi:hypothetical protein
MATYCTDADLVKYRPNILDLGVESWKEQREEAYALINRIIAARWFRRACPEMGYDPTTETFNPEYVADGTFTRLEAFKTLELAYMILKKDSAEADGFERNEKTFRDRYNEELEILLSIGIDYDWSGSGLVDDDEKYIRVPRRIVRA